MPPVKAVFQSGCALARYLNSMVNQPAAIIIKTTCDITYIAKNW